MIKRTKRMIGVIGLGSVFLIGMFFALPSYILSFNPEFEYGVFYYHAARNAMEKGNLSEAARLIDESMRLFPDNKPSRVLKNKIANLRNEKK